MGFTTSCSFELQEFLAAHLGAVRRQKCRPIQFVLRLQMSESAKLLILLPKTLKCQRLGCVCPLALLMRDFAATGGAQPKVSTWSGVTLQERQFATWALGSFGWMRICTTSRSFAQRVTLLLYQLDSFSNTAQQRSTTASSVTIPVWRPCLKTDITSPESLVNEAFMLCTQC